MSTLPELAARCATQAAPVLLLDTCALLDLIRIAGRSSPADDATPHPDNIPAAQHLLTLAQSATPQVLLICYELLPQEWQDNLAEVSRGPAAGLRRAQILLERFNQAAAALAIPSPAYRPAHLAERDGQAVINLLVALSRQVLDASHTLSRLAVCEERAVRRSISGTPPASKGKPELKDCPIIEHYLELCRQLPPAVPRVFISANVQDYGKSFNLFPPLDAEFEAAGLRWAKDFAHARSMLAL